MPKTEAPHSCSLCKTSFFRTDTLIRHLKRRHSGAGREEVERLYSLQGEMNVPDGVECPECNVMFKREHLGDHVVFAHNYTDSERSVLLKGYEHPVEAGDMPFKCKQCSSSFWTKRALSTHLNEEHPTADIPSTSSSVNGFVCAVDGCDSISATQEELVGHCAAAHKKETKQQFKLFDLSFENIDDFLEWKSEVEEQTCTSYRLRRSNNAHTAEYECHRTSFSVSKEPSSTEKALTKPCTAFIKGRMRQDGSVEAIGCTDHIGHTKDAEKLLLTLRQREEVRGLISKGVIPVDIIELMKVKYDERSRLHFLTYTDIALLDDTIAATESSDDAHTCPDCGEGPMSLMKLREHALRVHKNTSKLLDQGSQHEKENYSIYYFCDFCMFSCLTASVLEAHLQTYHARSRSEYEPKLPTPIPVNCPKCGLSFRTRYLLSVHCVGVHTTAMTDFSLIQISFDSWTHFEPWRTSKERDTKTVLVKSGMLACNSKLIHSYHCQFDQAVASSDQKEKIDKKPMTCPAFIQVIENEDGVLDCVACFGHLGHVMDGLPPEVNNEEDASMKVKQEEENSKDNVVPCFLCGNVYPPEIDTKICEEEKWCCCSNTECRSLVHEWCTRLFGKKCHECGKGVLVGE